MQKYIYLFQYTEFILHTIFFTFLPQMDAPYFRCWPFILWMFAKYGYTTSQSPPPFQPSTDFLVATLYVDDPKFQAFSMLILC